LEIAGVSFVPPFADDATLTIADRKKKNRDWNHEKHDIDLLQEFCNPVHN
jgi:hypothetical protein